MAGESSRKGSTSWSGLKNSLPIRKQESERRRRTSSGKWSNTRAIQDPSLNAEEEDYNEDDDKPFISIGIDLGTTYSGVAWAQSTRPKEVNIVRSWESNLSSTYDNHKVPSVLTYDSRTKKVTSWGYNLKERKHHISWFKLLLSKHATERLKRSKPERFKKLTDRLNEYDKEPVEVAADYLRCLWTHASKEISRRIGRDMWEIQTLRIVLTVPAIWDYEAQQLTRKAANLAGLLDREGTTLELIGEPEAAALSVFDEMTQDKQLKMGDPFVVCDAGGGTVDLISYTIEGLKPLRLAMCVEATGDLCGGIFIDSGFEKHIETDIMSPEEYSNIKTAAKREMLNDWEFGVKRQIKVDSPKDELFYVRLRGFRTAGVEPESPASSRRLFSTATASDISGFSTMSEDGHLALKVEDLQAIFQEECSKIKDLARAQVMGVKREEKRLPKAILLVGGFGQNEYLHQYLSQSFPDIEIRQPVNAWAAICRGAVLKGLGKEIVINHVSSYNYGTTHREEFDKTKHLAIDKEFDPDQNIYIANNQMDWVLRKGEDIEKNKPRRHSFIFRLHSREELKLKRAHIYYSDTPKEDLEKRKQPSVKLLCTLIMIFPTSIYDELPKFKNNNGEEYRELNFDLEMLVTSGEICWITKYKGIEIGSVRSTIGQEERTVDEPLDYAA